MSDFNHFRNFDRVYRLAYFEEESTFLDSFVNPLRKNKIMHFGRSNFFVNSKKALNGEDNGLWIFCLY